MSDPRPAAPALLLLAAGASTRLGFPKALAELGGHSVLERLLAAGRSMNGAPRLVVVGAHAREIAARLPQGVELCLHEGWRAGRTSSIQAGLARRVGRDVCLAPADTPLVLERTFEALVQSWEAHGAPAQGWLAPYVRDGPEAALHYGHPVILGRGLAQIVLAADPTTALRCLRERAEPLLGLEVDDPAILDRLKVAADLARLRKRIPSPGTQGA